MELPMRDAEILSGQMYSEMEDARRLEERVKVLEDGIMSREAHVWGRVLEKRIRDIEADLAFLRPKLVQIAEGCAAMGAKVDALTAGKP